MSISKSFILFCVLFRRLFYMLFYHLLLCMTLFVMLIMLSSNLSFNLLCLYLFIMLFFNLSLFMLLFYLFSSLFLLLFWCLRLCIYFFLVIIYRRLSSFFGTCSSYRWIHWLFRIHFLSRFWFIYDWSFGIMNWCWFYVFSFLMACMLFFLLSSLLTFFFLLVFVTFSRLFLTDNAFIVKISCTGSISSSCCRFSFNIFRICRI